MMLAASYIVLFIEGLLFVLVSYILFKHIRHKHKLRVNGCSEIAHYPHKDPILGSDLHFILQNGKKNNNLHGTVKNLLQTYGNGKTMQVLTWSIPTIISSDHRLIQAVLTTNFDNFGVEPVRMAFNKPWIGGGIVMSDGPSVTQCPEALVPQGAVRRSRYAGRAC